MKSIVVQKPVHDMERLLDALRKNDPPFSVVTIGLDEHRTYVYLDDKEEKDPTPLVEAWKDEAHLRIAVEGDPAPDGVHEALAGSEKFSLRIEKVSHETGEVLSGDEELQITIKAPEGSSCQKKRLVKGRLSIEIGPSRTPGAVQIAVVDRRIRLGNAVFGARFVTLRMLPEQVTEHPAPSLEAEGEDGSTLNEVEAAIRADLGIKSPPAPTPMPEASSSFWSKLFSKWKKA